MNTSGTSKTMARRRKTYRFPTIPGLSSAAGNDVSLQNNLPPLAITVFNAVDATAHVGAGIDPEFCHLPDTVPCWVRIFPECCWPSPNGARPSTWPRLWDGVRGWQTLFPHRLPMPRSKLSRRAPACGSADRNGVVDVRIPCELAPGWATVTLHVEVGNPVAKTC